MGNTKFIEKAKRIVGVYTLMHYAEKPDDVPQFEVYVVWNAFILGNIKALLATSLKDDMYYEVTYSKEKDEIYFDAYRKEVNKVLNPHSLCDEKEGGE